MGKALGEDATRGSGGGGGGPFRTAGVCSTAVDGSSTWEPVDGVDDADADTALRTSSTSA